jgi:hypothetical protein
MEGAPRARVAPAMALLPTNGSSETVDGNATEAARGLKSPLSPSRTGTPPTAISVYASKIGRWAVDTQGLAVDTGTSRDSSSSAETSPMEAPLSPLHDFTMSAYLSLTPSEQLVAETPVLNDGATFSPEENKEDPEHLHRALMRACSNGDAVRIRNILDALEPSDNFDLNKPDADGITPLIISSCYGQVDAVHELLLHGANPDAADTDGWTPLIWAANNRQPAVVRVLLSYNASVNPQTARGRTVRDFIGEDPTLRQLIEGAAADEPDPEGNKGHIGDGTMEDGMSSEKIEFSDDEGTVVSALTAISVNGSVPFDYTKCLPDQMFVFAPKDLPRILDVLVRHIKPARVRRGGAGEKGGEESVPVPANVIYLAARYAHHYHGGDLMDMLLDAAGQQICLALNVGQFFG